MKTTAFAVALVAMGTFALPVQAQNANSASGGTGASASNSSAPSGQVLVAMDKNDAPVAPLNLMVGQVGDMTVIGSDGNEIGNVKNVLGDQNGDAKAITVDVGGFLGLGQKTVILSLGDIALDMGKLKTNLTRDQIENLPDFSG